MKLARPETLKPVLPDRLQRRMESMGIPVALLDAQGRVHLSGRCGRLAKLLGDSPLLAKAGMQNWTILRANIGRPVSLWPGLWYLPLPAEHRRRFVRRGDEDQIVVAILMSPSMLNSEQFHLVCDLHQVDYQATVDQIDQQSMVDETQIDHLATVLSWMRQDSLEIGRCHDDLASMSKQLGESYEELSLLYKLSANMMVNQPPMHFLTDACQDLRQVVGLKWMALQLGDDKRRLKHMTGQMFTAGHVGCDTDMLREIGRQLMVHQEKSAGATVVEDTSQVDIAQLPAIGSDLLSVPIAREGKPFGILFGCDKLDGSPLSSIDSKLCASLASSLSILLENTVLYEDLHAIFMGTLHALTSSIDAKDSYTRGHSERVALMSRMLAEAAGLGQESIERVYLSALVHDIGKIGVPEAVLCKPGKLSPEEFERMKEHPEIGTKILSDIEQMQDLIPGVLYHHEWWDGNGYPQGLAGQDIPMFGRLICLSDSFDAMTSQRTYRQTMAIPECREEIIRSAGSQFDPDLAQIFVEMDFTPVTELAHAHQNNGRFIRRIL